MVDQVSTRRWLYWALLVVIALAIVLVKILPLDLTTGKWPGPDWLVAIGLAWALRRPDYVPALLFAVLLLFADFLYVRPPGLWAAIGVVGLEFVRSRAQFSRDLPFLVEWAMVGGVIAAMTVTNRIVLAVFVIDQPNFGLEVLRLLATISIYPIVVAVSANLLGVRKVAHGEVDQLGHRI